MHSSMMRTAARSSSRHGEGGPHPPPRSRHPPGQIPLNFPLGCGPGDPPARSPLTSPFGVGLETCKACRDTMSWRPAARHAGIPPAMHAGIAQPCGQNDRHV